MARDLHFTTCVLLCILLTAYGLKCKYCVREAVGGHCENEINICHTKPNQMCIAIVVTHEGELMYRMEGCASKPSDCYQVRKDKHGYLVKGTCCNYNMCNHHDGDT